MDFNPPGPNFRFYRNFAMDSFLNSGMPFSGRRFPASTPGVLNNKIALPYAPLFAPAPADEGKLKRSAPKESALEVIAPPKRNKVEIDMNCSCSYHLDIWFEISKFIAPEDVSTFARICKHTLFVVRSGLFWMTLYHTYYMPTKYIPLALQGDLSDKHGLKSKVIRSMFYLYPKFVKRLWHTRVETSRIINMVCVEQKQELHYRDGCVTFMYKFLDIDYAVYLKEKEQEKKTVDVNANRDLGAIALKLTTKKIQLESQEPVLVGTMLLAINIKRVKDGAYALIQSYDYTRKENPKRTHMLDNIIAVQMNDWWHPCYPHMHPFPSDERPCLEGCIFKKK